MGNSTDKNDYTWGVFLLLICLVAEGFLVDSQVFIKKTYQPSSNDLFLCTNKVAFFLSFGSSFMSGELQKILRFITMHEGFATDLFLLSICGTIGQFFVYELIKKF